MEEQPVEEAPAAEEAAAAEPAEEEEPKTAAPKTKRKAERKAAPTPSTEGVATGRAKRERKQVRRSWAVMALRRLIKRGGSHHHIPRSIRAAPLDRHRWSSSSPAPPRRRPTLRSSRCAVGTTWPRDGRTLQDALPRLLRRRQGQRGRSQCARRLAVQGGGQLWRGGVVGPHLPAHRPPHCRAPAPSSGRFPTVGGLVCGRARAGSYSCRPPAPGRALGMQLPGASIRV